MVRHGDTCCLCGDPILDVNEIVRPTAEPWRLLEPGIAHRDCANDAVAQAVAGRQSAEDAYRDAMGWPEGD
jgi:hypothetical protein